MRVGAHIVEKQRGKAALRLFYGCSYMSVRYGDRDPFRGRMAPNSPPLSGDGYQPILLSSSCRHRRTVVLAGCMAGCGARGVRYGALTWTVAVIDGASMQLP